jgi:hypothetical protein
MESIGSSCLKIEHSVANRIKIAYCNSGGSLGTAEVKATDRFVLIIANSQWCCAHSRSFTGVRWYTIEELVKRTILKSTTALSSPLVARQLAWNSVAETVIRMSFGRKVAHSRLFNAGDSPLCEPFFRP